jgi:hypothetical protein
MRRLGGILASLLLACLVNIGLMSAAQGATPPSLEVCNSINSVGDIAVYVVPSGGNHYVAKGTCITLSPQDDIRVDVDPEWPPGHPDVDSYYIGVEGQGYGPIHCTENDASNPPNVDPLYVKYNTNSYGC